MAHIDLQSDRALADCFSSYYCKKIEDCGVPLSWQGEKIGILEEKICTLLKKAAISGVVFREDQVELLFSSAQEVQQYLEQQAYAWFQIGYWPSWRQERCTVYREQGREALFTLPRPAFRIFGLLSEAVHMTGWVKGKEDYYWLGQRAAHKRIAPRLWDNTACGCVQAGETVLRALVRESQEEAGVEKRLLASALPARIVEICRPLEIGVQYERIYSFGLPLAQRWQPNNQDGEVHCFAQKSQQEIIALIIQGKFMLDSALALSLIWQANGHLHPSSPLDQFLQSLLNERVFSYSN